MHPIVGAGMALAVGLPGGSAADDGASHPAQTKASFRGVYFNPLVKAGDPNFPWLSFYPEYRGQVCTALRELVSTTGINLVDIFVCIAAMWCMMGNYEFGAAEPCLWERDDNPAILSSTEQFVKRVWPVFRAAGKRPKAAPILLPIFSNKAYWTAKTPEARLSAFTNLKKWLIDDLAMPPGGRVGPDYWVMTTYAFCDPAPDGFHYLRAIIAILGPENASRLVSTDLKGPGHDDVRDCIVSNQGHSGPELLEWHFRKCAEYGLAGWWIWAYQDTPTANTGIRDVAGTWKDDLVHVIREKVSSDTGERKLAGSF